MSSKKKQNKSTRRQCTLSYCQFKGDEDHRDGKMVSRLLEAVFHLVP